MNSERCPVCNSRDISVFIEISDMPIYCNWLLPTRKEALASPKGDIRLGYCKICGHIFNTAFDPGLMDYDQQYENSLHFSPRFQTYAEELAQRLVEDYELHDKDIIEIGCGKGDFLTLLCAMGQNRGLGFDPSYEKERATTQVAAHLHIIHDYFSESYDKYPADFICCRHVLEHIPEPRRFIESVRRTIGTRTEPVVYFEVPDVTYTLKDMGIWDLIYEHCGYFNQSSLSYLFRSCGFTVLKLQTHFEGQFLCIDAKPTDNNAATRESNSLEADNFYNYISAFSENYRAKVTHWNAVLDQLILGNQKAVIWGSGSKGVTFLNVLKNSQQIKYAVDINPYKQGRFVPGTGQKIVPPDLLSEFQPQVIIVMNPNYLGEIQQKAEQLGITPKFLIV